MWLNWRRFFSRFDFLVAFVFFLLLCLSSLIADPSRHVSLTFVYAVAFVGFSLPLSSKRSHLKVSKILALLLVFLVVTVLSSIFSVAVYNSVIFVLCLVAVVMFYLISLNFDFPERILLHGLVVGGLLQSSLGLRDFLLKGSYVSLLGKSVTGSFGLPNLMAGYLLIPLFVTLGLYLDLRNQKWLQFFYVASLLIISSAFFLTYSRGAWLSFLVGGGVFLGLTSRGLKRIVGRLAVIAVVIGTCLILGGKFLAQQDILKAKIAAVSRGGSTSFIQRLYMYRKAIKIGGDHLLFGTGPASFSRSFQIYLDRPWFYSRDAHSFFLQIFADTGLLGLSCWIIFLVCFLIPALRRVSSAGTSYLVVSLISAVVAASFHNLIDFDWYNPAVMLSFFILPS